MVRYSNLFRLVKDLLFHHAVGFNSPLWQVIIEYA